VVVRVIKKVVENVIGQDADIKSKEVDAERVLLVAVKKVEVISIVEYLYLML
jgi:hypothetical protein